MYKVMTAMISDSMYKHLEVNKIMPWEQNGCAKRSRGTKDQLLIDKNIIRDCRTHKKNLVMGWIDYRKEYDMVPHSWIEEVMRVMEIADNIKKFMLDSMQRWKIRLEYEGKQLGEVRIKREIFQRDSLSPLMFVMAMIPMTCVLK